MACPDENTLVAFASGALPMADAARVEEHLDGCAVCFALVAELARTAPEEAEPTQMLPLGDDLIEDPEPTQHAAPSPRRVEPAGVALPPPRAAVRPPTRGIGDASTHGQLDTPSAPMPALITNETVVARVIVTPAPTPVRPARPPPQIGRYTLLHRIGLGESGAVYAAQDREFQRRVALRLLNAPAPEPGIEPPWQAAARALARVTHPNLLTVFEAGCVDDHPYIATELVEGITLAQWLRASSHSWRERLEKFVAAAGGLEAAHAVGVVHGGFRPSNVLLDEQGRARVTDFGLDTNNPFHDEARTVVRGNPLELEASGSVVIGARTQAYAAPEQYEGRIEARTDQFAWCSALFEALFERLPFDAPDPAQLRARVLSGVPPDIPLRSDVPDWLVAILLRGLARDPERRFASMGALLAAIGAAQRRRRALLRGGLIGTAALVAVTTLVAVLRPGEAPCGDTAIAARVWDAAARERVGAAVAAANSSYGSALWASARTLVDREVERHDALATEACGVEPPLRAARVECMQRWVLELEAFVGEWSTLQATALPSLLDSARALGSSESCVDVGAWARAPESDAAAQTRRDVHGALASARALASVGLLDRANARATAAMSSADALADRGLRGEAQLVLGEVLQAQARPHEAAAELDRAMQSAIAAADPRLLVRAATRAAANASTGLARPELALQHVVVGRGALERLPHERGAAAELAHQEGLAQLAAAAHDAARRAFEAELAALQRDGAGEDVRVAMALRELARARAAAGQLEAALADCRRAHAVAQGVLGAGHPVIAGVDVELGELLTRLGRYDEADEVLQRALESAPLLAEPRGAVAAHAHFQRGLVAYGQQAYERAAAELELALDARRTLLGERDPAVGDCWSWLARARREQGRWDLADVAARSAVAVIDPKRQPDAWAHGRAVLADVLWRAGDRAAAIAGMDEARAILGTITASPATLDMLSTWQAAHRLDSPPP